MSDLKPCPFCGGAVNIVYNSLDDAFRVYHNSGMDAIECVIREPFEIDVPNVKSLAKARKAWNRRAHE